MSTGIGGVLFDKDGTLIDFRATWLPAYEAIVRDLFGANPGAADRLLRAGGYGRATGQVNPTSVLAAGTNGEIAALWAEMVGRADVARLADEVNRLFMRHAQTSLVPVTDLPALFANDDALANAWIAGGEATRDPVWRMPLWRPYLRYLTSGIADLANAGSRMAGAVTAALYLERFVPDGMPWAHLDVYAWNDSDRAGRPAGGEALALRSAYAMLKARYGG